MTEDLPDGVSQERALGRLEGKVDSLEERVTRNETNIDTRLSGIERDLKTLVQGMAEGRGGMRVGSWIVSLIAGTAGALLGHFLPVGK